MTTNPARRALALTLLAPALALLAGCPPKDGTAARQDDTPATQVEASAPKPESNEIKGLDTAPVLNRTEMGNGLIIEDLKLGEGDPCWPGSVVQVHFRIWAVANGKLFEDTYAKGAPRDIRLKTTIKGVSDGVPGMKVGGKRRLYIPPDMAYRFTTVRGENDEVLVPQLSPLIAEVEVLAIRPARFVSENDSSLSEQKTPAENPAPAPR